MKSFLLFVALAAFSIVAFAGPEENVGGKKHPNLHAAQELTEKAFNRISAAQAANEFDMDGHAAKAKALLDQASKEIKMAAEAANKGKK
ncbi:MAG: hypothetical protein JO142_14160 [Burkholderiales bacterium]|nr:hypothetical protein [Burkholderiales bacterium]